MCIQPKGVLKSELFYIVFRLERNWFVFLMPFWCCLDHLQQPCNWYLQWSQLCDGLFCKKSCPPSSVEWMVISTKSKLICNDVCCYSMRQMCVEQTLNYPFAASLCCLNIKTSVFVWLREVARKVKRAWHLTYSFLPNWGHGLKSSNHCAFWKTTVWIILTWWINRKPWS